MFMVVREDLDRKSRVMFFSNQKSGNWLKIKDKCSLARRTTQQQLRVSAKSNFSKTN